MTENNANIPPAKGFDEFQTLSSTKQNIELFKILSAIAEEIEGLRQSTERRFHLIESLVQQNGKEIIIEILTKKLSCNEMSEKICKIKISSQKCLYRNRTYFFYTNVRENKRFSSSFSS